MPKLGVNIDHVATIRQARRTVEPDPVWAAIAAQLGGADCITVHLREDRRHIQDRDVHVLKETVKVKFNLEMAASDEIIKIAREVVPTQATLVPERREELTTEGGLDVVANFDKVKQAVAALKEKGIIVSLFVNPDGRQLESAWRAGADAVELHAGRYAGAKGAQVEESLIELKQGCAIAGKLRLLVHAGHGLTYANAGLAAMVPGFEEFNIGHSIISRAVFVGIEEAVREMKRVITV
jgi:pyridoxine 5-phosphate synthase